VTVFTALFQRRSGPRRGGRKAAFDRRFAGGSCLLRAGLDRLNEIITSPRF